MLMGFDLTTESSRLSLSPVSSHKDSNPLAPQKQQGHKIYLPYPAPVISFVCLQSRDDGDYTLSSTVVPSPTSYIPERIQRIQIQPLYGSFYLILDYLYFTYSFIH